MTLEGKSSLVIYTFVQGIGVDIPYEGTEEFTVYINVVWSLIQYLGS